MTNAPSAAHEVRITTPEDDPDDLDTLEFIGLSPCVGNGDIRLCAPGQDPQDAPVAGVWGTVYLDLDAAEREDISPFDYVDSFDQEIFDVCDQLYTRNFTAFGRTTKELLEMPRARPNMLFVDHVALYPEYRGQRIAEKALPLIILQERRRASIAAARIYPLQFNEFGFEPYMNSEREFDFSDLPQDEALSMGKLGQCCERAGFVNVPGTDYFIMQVSSAPHVRKPLV